MIQSHGTTNCWTNHWITYCWARTIESPWLVIPTLQPGIASTHLTAAVGWGSQLCRGPLHLPSPCCGEGGRSALGEPYGIAEPSGARVRCLSKGENKVEVWQRPIWVQAERRKTCSLHGQGWTRWILASWVWKISFVPLNNPCWCQEPAVCVDTELPGHFFYLLLLPL